MVEILANNNSDLKTMFQGRKEFRESAYAEAPSENFIDTYTDKVNYGKVDTNYNFVYCEKSFYKPVLEQSLGTMTQDFVSDAFSDYIDYVRRSIQNEVIQQDGPFSSMSPAPTSGHPLDLYRTKTANILNDFNKQFLSNPNYFKNVLNFEDYLNLFKKFYNENSEKTPLLFSNFYKTSSCPIDSTGLVVSFGNYDAGDDSVKYNLYIDQFYFDYYSNSARKFGFKVDKNRPWTLVADISSREMIRYMNRYNLNSKYDLFNRRYKLCVTEDMRLFTDLIILSYNNFINLSPTINKTRVIECFSRMKTFTKSMNRKVLTDFYKQKLPFSNFMIDFYFDQKIKESMTLFDINIKKDKDKIINKYKKSLRTEADLRKYLVSVESLTR